MKLNSGSTPEAADFVDALYRKVIPGGTHKASSIRVFGKENSVLYDVKHVLAASEVDGRL